MNTKDALAKLGVTEHTLSEQQRQDLDDKGYFVVPNVFTATQCAEIGAAIDALQAVEGEQGGHEVHTEAGAPRLSNILNKSNAFDICLTIKPLLAGAHYLLGDIKVHGFNARDALAGQGHQPMHSDGGAYDVNRYSVVNSLILIDPFTETNGATRIVPGTHKTGLRAQETLDEPLDPHPDEVIVTAPAGSVAVLNAHVWHGGTLNVSGARRRVLHLSYCRRDEPQQLVQQDYLTPALYNRMNDVQHYLLDIQPYEQAVIR